MKNFEDYFNEGWHEEICFGCGGHGMVSDYGNGEDFYGAKECKTCGGKGKIWLTPKGRHVEYPGGKFV